MTFIADGVEIQSETMTYGTAIDAPAAPEKTGYTFTGWDKEVATTVPDSSVTYTAVYTPNIYKVTFIADSVEIRADSLQYGTAITVPEAPAKTGYTFTGWLPAVAETVPADDVTYVAQYSINSYTVTFLREDGVTPISSEAMPYGTAITAPEAPAKTGYTFIGWSPAVAETVPDSSVTYTAQYKVNKYLMTFTVDGAVFQQDSLEYGSAMVVPDSIPVKEGYTFNSWGGGLLPETVPAHDETYPAYFDINSYNWIFMVDDSVVHSGVVAYGSPLLDPGVSQFTVKEGYTFSGWNPYPWPETMPAEDLIIRGYFTINKYLVTFTDVEGTLSSDSLEYAQAITAPTAREKEGYTFKEWVPAVDATVPSHDVTYTAGYVINSYLVTFKADSVTIIQSDSIAYGTAITAPEAPAKVGYTFTGWSPAVDPTVPAKDVTYTAQYTINSYLVTFKSDSTTVIKSDSIAYGTVISAPANPEKEGYTFTGWSPAVDATVPAHDVTYTATFIINKYLITFTEGGVVTKSDSLEYGAAVVAPEIQNKDAYVGWSNLPTTMPAHDVVVEARPNTGLYQIAFVANDSVIQSDELQYGTAITAPADPKKEGYTFTGWSPAVDETVPAHDVTYTAQFRINSYLVTFKSDSTTVIKSDSIAYGTAITAPTAPTKVGYTFTGWSPAVDPTVPAKDVTYTAQYTINSYLVTFKSDSTAVIKSDSIAYGTAITAPANPEKEGYTFTGWSPAVDATVPAHDVTYTATFIINKYLITFTEGGVVTKSDSLEYGAEVIAPEIQNKDAYVGWSNLPTTMPAHDVVVEARPNTGLYQIAFVANDTVIQSDELQYGTAITAPADPKKEGYTFTGWSPAVDATVPAHDVTYTAQFSINKYYVAFYLEGRELYADSLEYGATIPEINFEHDGYNYMYEEWYETVPAHDVSVNIILVPIAYTVTFITEGDSISEYLDYGTAITKPEDPKKEGYTFTGWSPEVDETVPAHNVTYTAQFTVNFYNVTFKDEDGTIYQSDSLAYGSAITAPANPTKEGHTFAGWNPQVDATVPAHDATYVAQWDIDPVLIEAHDELIAGQTALDQKKASIDANYNAGVTAYNNLLQQFATVEEEAAPFANKFAADTEAIRNKLAALQTPIDSYNQFQVKDFTAEIEELYNERTLLSQQQRIEEEMKNASADLDVLSDSVDAVLAAIDKVAEEVNVLQAAIANATVTPLNGIATVVDPMGGLDAILQNKEDVTKLTITGQMEGADFATLLKVPNVEELTLPAVNSKTDSIRLGGLSNLLVVKLEDANTVLGDEVFTGCNPNLMVYAVKGADIGVLNCNVILSSEAEEVVLTDGYPVRITDKFSAQRISYTRSFSKKTYIGQSAGWETLALPFAVDNITAQDGRLLVPFGEKADANFWLATVGETGFNSADAIEANKPYLIAMPNNSAYTEGNITGNVTFSATDAEVTPTIAAEPINAYYTFTAVYEGEPDYENIYAINSDDYQTYYPGSVFVRGLRAVRPFEAFITTNGESGAKQRNLIPIGINSATGLMQIAAEQNGQFDGVYSLDGRKVAETTDNLPAGIYIVGGKKYIVR